MENKSLTSRCFRQNLVGTMVTKTLIDLSVCSLLFSIFSQVWPAVLHVLGVHDVQILGINHSRKQADPEIKKHIKRIFSYLKHMIMKATCQNHKQCHNIFFLSNFFFYKQEVVEIRSEVKIQVYKLVCVHKHIMYTVYLTMLYLYKLTPQSKVILSRISGVKSKHWSNWIFWHWTLGFLKPFCPLLAVNVSPNRNQ